MLQKSGRRIIPWPRTGGNDEENDRLPNPEGYGQTPDRMTGREQAGGRVCRADALLL